MSVTGGSAWTWNNERGEYYLHQFGRDKPDLNLRNEAVVEELKDVLRFWLDKGVDGFRLEAAGHLLEDAAFRDEPRTASDYNAVKHPMTFNHPDSLDILREFRDVLDAKTEEDSYYPRILMTDVPDLTNAELVDYYGTNFTDHSGDAAQMPLNHGLIDQFERPGDLTADKIKSVVDDYLDAMPDPGAWPNFNLGNKDRERVATRLGHDVVDLFNMVYMLLPGSPVTYYGEEIGMSDGTGRQPDSHRTPMQWDSSGGFTSGTPWLPMNSDAEHVNVEQQLASTANSHIKVYKELAKLRRQTSVLFGSFTSAVNETVYGYSRVKKGNPGYLIAVNLGDEAVDGIDFSEFPMVPEQGLVVTRSHHDREDKAKEVELAEDEEEIGYV